MRLFVAVDVDADTRRAVERLRRSLRDRHPVAERALRWVEPANLHLTLRFLGEQDPGPIEAALRAPFDPPRFTMTWSGPAWLPPRGRPRVFYLAVDEGAATLRALADELAARFGAIGIPPEDRPFTAHLTLARVREGADPHVVRTLESSPALATPAAGLRVGVDAVVLYESRLSPHGSTYVVRHRSRLRQP